jgi:AraC-like DNA-binding protein
MMPDSPASPVLSCSFEEPEQMAELLALADLDVLVLAGTRRPWKHITVSLGALTLDWGYSPSAIMARGSVGPAACMNFGAAEPGHSILWNGRPLERHQFVVSSPGAEFSATSGASTHVALFAAPEAWSRSLRALHGAGDWTLHSGCSVFRSEPDAMDRLRRLVDLAISVCQDMPEVLHHPEARRGMADSLFGAMAAAADSARSDRRRATIMLSHARIIRRAEDVIRQRVDEPIHLVDLCAATQVSERTLRTAFYDIYRTSPTKYLQIRRLHQVRRALRHADPARATVTAVAGQYGFWELGRFAGHYKALFGETPSQTLHGATSRPPHLADLSSGWERAVRVEMPTSDEMATERRRVPARRALPKPA